jgi:hypothetical protein
MKPLIYLMNTGLLAMALYPLTCLYFFDDMSWTGFRLFAAVQLMVFCFLLVSLCILRMESRSLDLAGRLAAWLLALGWSMVFGVFVVVKLKGWGEFTDAFLFALPCVTSIGISALLRYRQFRDLWTSRDNREDAKTEGMFEV